MARLEDRRFFVGGVAQQVQGGQCFRDLYDHVVHQVGVAGDIGEFRLVVEQAGTDHDRQQHFADFVLGGFEPGRFTQEHAFHEANAPAAQVGVVRLFAKVEVAWQLELLIGCQLAGDVGLELDQGFFDLGALGLVLVVRLFGEQRVDPFTVRDLLRADR